MRLCDINLAKKWSTRDEPDMNVPTHAFFSFVPTTMTKHHDRQTLSVMTKMCLAPFLDQKIESNKYR